MPSKEHEDAVDQWKAKGFESGTTSPDGGKTRKKGLSLRRRILVESLCWFGFCDEDRAAISRLPLSALFSVSPWWTEGVEGSRLTFCTGFNPDAWRVTWVEETSGGDGLLIEVVEVENSSNRSVADFADRLTGLWWDLDGIGGFWTAMILYVDRSPRGIPEPASFLAHLQAPDNVLPDLVERVARTGSAPMIDITREVADPAVAGASPGSTCV